MAARQPGSVRARPASPPPSSGTSALQAAGRSLTGTPWTTLGMPFWLTTMSGTARTWPDLSSTPLPSTQDPEAGVQLLITLLYVVTAVR